MKSLDRLRKKLGDFWYYSFLMFMASRAADVLNAFVGLWLVPKYVPPSELGALLPIMNFASFLAFPMAVVTSTFRNEITGLSIRGEFGRLKTLLRGVFIASAVFLFAAIVVSHFLLPHFLERIRIVEGSLGILILATTFVGAVHPVYSTAMQALKKFNALSVINLVSAPLRLVTMLAAMPLRAITGYFAGQISSPIFSIIASVFALKKEFSVPAQPYWSREVAGRVGRLLLVFAVGGVAGGFSGLVELTVLRQRLCDLDSAAYYMVTRFSDIAGFLYVTLVFTLFPFTAELAAKGKDLRPMIFKTAAATIAFSALTALFFFVCGEFLLGILPHGNEFSQYWWAIPWIIGINTMTYIVTIYTTAEVSANRFRYMRWLIPLTLAYPIALLAVTGRGYFAAFLPPRAMSALESLNVTTLEGMLWWMTAFAAAKLAGVLIFVGMRKENT